MFVISEDGLFVYPFKKGEKYFFYDPLGVYGYSLAFSHYGDLIQRKTFVYYKFSLLADDLLW